MLYVSGIPVFGLYEFPAESKGGGRDLIITLDYFVARYSGPYSHQ
jgi:hypothetical protein